MSSCARSTRRNRRNRRSKGGSAGLNEAFADLKGNGAAPKMDVPPAPPAPASNGAQKGGRRKSRKLSKGAKAWTTAVTKLYREMKVKDKSAKFSDALKRASALKKRGEL
jgi:hypothetical protein